MSESTVATMEAEKVYKTCESELSYFAKLEKQNGDKTGILVFMPKSGKWKALEVPATYKIRELTEAETVEFSQLSVKKARKPLSVKKARKPRVPKDPNAPKKERVPKAVGITSGLKMLAAWGLHISINIDKVGGRTQTINDMLVDFPAKAESINRWVDAYLTYFNTGRIAGYPRLEKSKFWVLSNDEKAALVTRRAENKLKKTAVPPAEVPAA